MKNITLALLGAASITLSPLAAADITTCTPDSAGHAVARAFQDRWSAAIASADVAAIAANYAESAVLMPPGEESYVGREPVAGYLAGTSGKARPAVTEVDLVSCELRDHTLHVAGVWGSPGADGGPWQTGNLVRVLEADAAGEWHTKLEIWN
ncbi:MAG: hypothetical protein ACU85V_10945 [Gammaproteobacteria bacterium]